MRDFIPSRRKFLKDSGAIAAGVAGISMLPTKFLDQRRTGHELLADHYAIGFDDAEMLALAKRALDAAKAAGADYADVRVNRNRTVQVNVNTYGGAGMKNSTFIYPGVSAGFSIGVRAVVKGSWGFTGDTRVSPEIADRVGKMATAFARDGHKVSPKGFDFAPAPVVADGRWETPIEIDPFSIPLGEIVERYKAGRDVIMAFEAVDGLGGTPNWSLSERIFVSSEGSTIRQKVYEATPGLGSWAPRPNDRRYWVSGDLDIRVGHFGYETLASYDLNAKMTELGERLTRLSKEPYKMGELGQYDIVFGQTAMSVIMLPTAQALRLDRAIGDLADSSGTSFAAPPEDVIGKYKLGTPAINITADRSRPRVFGTVGWDEEGVKPETFPLVKDGVIHDFITTRAYAPSLANVYAQRGQAMRSHGCATRTGRLQPMLNLPNLTLEADPKGGSVEDLIKQVKRGYYVQSCGMMPDQQLLNVQLPVSRTYEIINGKLGSAIEDVAVQVTLPRLWGAVAALGNAATLKQEWLTIDGSDADMVPNTIGCMVPPALVRNQNVITLGRES